MPARRANPYRVKLHRIYSVQELAECLGVHKNTVRHWLDAGLKAIDGKRPTLFEGTTARAFLLARKTSRKRPCPPGTIYCFKCREPHAPALGMVEFIPGKGTTGNLTALCDTCGTAMHRRANVAKIAAIMPRLDVQIRQAPSRLIERAPAPLATPRYLALPFANSSIPRHNRSHRPAWNRQASLSFGGIGGSFGGIGAR